MDRMEALTCLNSPPYNCPTLNSSTPTFNSYAYYTWAGDIVGGWEESPNTDYKEF